MSYNDTICLILILTLSLFNVDVVFEHVFFSTSTLNGTGNVWRIYIYQNISKRHAKSQGYQGYIVCSHGSVKNHQFQGHLVEVLSCPVLLCTSVLPKPNASKRLIAFRCSGFWSISLICCLCCSWTCPIWPSFFTRSNCTAFKWFLRIKDSEDRRKAGWWLVGDWLVVDSARSQETLWAYRGFL